VEGVVEGWVGRIGADAEETERVPAAAEVVGVGEAGAGEHAALAVEDGEGDAPVEVEGSAAGVVSVEAELDGGTGLCGGWIGSGVEDDTVAEDSLEICGTGEDIGVGR